MITPTFADQTSRILSTDGDISLVQTTISMNIPSDNILPWGFVEGVFENHASGFPVIIQIYQNDEAIHFAKTNEEDDGSYEFRDDAVSHFTGWSSDAETFTITATISTHLAIKKGIVPHNHTTPVTIDKVLSINKSKQGAEGLTTSGVKQWRFLVDQVTPWPEPANEWNGTKDFERLVLES